MLGAGDFINESTKLEDIFFGIFLVGGIGVGLIVAVGLWILFARRRSS